MVSFQIALALVLQASSSEPLNQRMAPRAIALEISKVAESVEEAAKMADTAFHEGRNVPTAIGDHGKSLCVYQLQFVPVTVLRDLHLCTVLAVRKIRAAAAICPEHPLAPYVSGNCGAGHQISDRRMAEVAELVAAVVSD